jgi:hypothetical protein
MLHPRRPRKRHFHHNFYPYNLPYTQDVPETKKSFHYMLSKIITPKPYIFKFFTPKPYTNYLGRLGLGCNIFILSAHILNFFLQYSTSFYRRDEILLDLNHYLLEKYTFVKWPHFQLLIINGLNCQKGLVRFPYYTQDVPEHTKIRYTVQNMTLKK